MAVVLSIVSIFGYVFYAWRQQKNSLLALKIINDMMRWDKGEIPYQEARANFHKAASLSPAFPVTYREWGIFCMAYTRFYDKHAGLFSIEDFKDFSRFVQRISDAKDPVSQYLKEKLTPFTHKDVLIKLNEHIQGPSIYNHNAFKKVKLSEKTNQLRNKLLNQTLKQEEWLHLNRLLLDDAYPDEIYGNQHKYYQEAEPKFLQAVSLDPDDYISFYYLFLIHSTRGECAETKKYIYRVFETVKKLPEDVKNEFTLGAKAMEATEEAKQLKGKAKTKKQNEAIAYLKQSIRYNPNLFCARNGLGTAYMAQGNYEEAEKYLNESLQLGPLYRPALENRGKIYLLYARRLLGRGIESVDEERGDTPVGVVKGSRGIDPKFAEHLQKARRDLEEAARLACDSKIYYDLAKICALQGAHQDALNYLKLAVEKGFKDYKQLEQDKDFRAMKDSPEFKELLNKAGK
jgi:tetratricopeptide (TPR) repeat protein